MDERQRGHDQVWEKEEVKPKGGNEKLQFVVEGRGAFQQGVRVNLSTVGEVQVAKVRGKNSTVARSETQFQGKPK